MQVKERLSAFVRSLVRKDKMETIAEFIKSNKLGLGEVLTNGKDHWSIKKNDWGYGHTAYPYYLHTCSKDGTLIGGTRNWVGHVPATIMETVCIPNLTFLPKKVRAWKYVVHVAGGEFRDPETTEHWYKGSEDLAEHYAGQNRKILHYSKISFTEKEFDEEVGRKAYL